MDTQRYQIYLDTQSVAIYDDLSSELGVNRSRLMRSVLKQVALIYAKAIAKPQTYTLKNHPLMKMCGAIQGSSTDLSTKVDEMYLHD